MSEVGLPPLPELPPPGTPGESRRQPTARARELQRELSGGIDEADAADAATAAAAAPTPRTLDFGSDPNPLSELEKLEKIGEGSFGEVWRVLHKRSHSVLAAKLITIDDNLEELFREVKTMQELDHPNIVRLYTSYKFDSQLWLVMEFCSARSLRNVMKSLKRGLTEAEIAAVMRQMLDALAYLHSLRRIHRDLKAGNILLCNDGTAKLGDFGVAGQITDTQRRRHTMIGSPYWMAPEVIEDTGHDQKADIWSLGITAIELAQTEPPWFDSNPMKVIFMIPHNDPPTLKEEDKWTIHFKEFLANCLIKSPDDRWSASDLQRLPFITTAGASERLKSVAQEHEAVLAAHPKAQSPSALLPMPPVGSPMSTSPHSSADMSLTVERRDLPSISGSMALRVLNDLDLSTRQVMPCPNCELYQQRIRDLEKTVADLQQKLLTATSEANLYKGQAQVYERLLGGSIKLAPRP